jgi:hypothetical protein
MDSDERSSNDAVKCSNRCQQTQLIARYPTTFMVQSSIIILFHPKNRALQLRYAERLTYHHCRPHTKYKAHEM